MFVKNNRPTLIHFPEDDAKSALMPSASRPCTPEQVEKWKKNKAMAIYFDVGYLTLHDAPENVTPPTQPQSDKDRVAELAAIKAKKIENVAKMTTIEQIAAIAPMEKDADVLKAMNERAEAIHNGQGAAVPVAASAAGKALA